MPKTAAPPASPARRKTAAKTSRKTAPAAARGARIEVRDSRIHGRGVYAARDLHKGERIIQYTGRLISWKEADRLPPSDPNDPNHTFLFSLSDGKRVIDARAARNAARWINHSCDPNCETEETEDGRVFIEALRDIPRGEELHYDYCLVIDEKITKKLKRQYRCLCGAPQCRGTMLALKKKSGKKKKKKKD
jgi:SET domain-containing protein